MVTQEAEVYLGGWILSCFQYNHVQGSHSLSVVLTRILPTYMEPRPSTLEYLIVLTAHNATIHADHLSYHSNPDNIKDGLAYPVLGFSKETQGP